MMNTSPLAWLLWDPNRELITLPFIGKPILWYGFCFVMGFVIGYWLVLPMFRKLLTKEKSIKARDILSYATLVHQLKNPAGNHKGIKQQLLTLLPSQLIQELNCLEPQQEPNQFQATSLLNALNKLYHSTRYPLAREDLEMAFPGAIQPIKQQCFEIADRLLWYLIAGALIGARLGHVFFYNWPIFREDPASIVKIWEGGLASHGGAIGIIIALLLFTWRSRSKYPEISLIKITDIVVIPTALAGCLIRIGNFFNQEILGLPSTLPWAVIFGHPADGSMPEPRHPVQLYEAGAYLLIFMLIYSLWNRFNEKLRPGIMAGLFLISIFSARFALEFFKETQSQVIDESFLLTGQYLSVPFILLGGLFLFFGASWDSSKRSATQLKPESPPTI